MYDLVAGSIKFHEVEILQVGVAYELVSCYVLDLKFIKSNLVDFFKIFVKEDDEIEGEI
jgi:hypothetical protein